MVALADITERKKTVNICTYLKKKDATFGLVYNELFGNCSYQMFEPMGVDDNKQAI